MEKSEFLSFFYKHSMHVMTASLFAATCDDRPSKGKSLLLNTCIDVIKGVGVGNGTWLLSCFSHSMV